MDSFINSSLPIWGYILILVLIFGFAFLWEYKTKKKNLAKELKYFEMNEKPLTSQTLFWLAIIIPFASFCYFGYFSWYGKPFLFNAEGFERFIKISALPLGLLSLSIPFSAIVNNIHRTIQTNAQINSVNIKNNSDIYYSHRKNTMDYFNALGKIDVEFHTSFKDNYVKNRMDIKLSMRIDDSFKLYHTLFPYSHPHNCILSLSEKITKRINRCWCRIDYLLMKCLEEKNTCANLIRKMIKINKYLEIIERTLCVTNNLSKIRHFRFNSDNVIFGVSFRFYEEFNARLESMFKMTTVISSIVGNEFESIVNYKSLDLFLSKNNAKFYFINNSHDTVSEIGKYNNKLIFFQKIKQ
ncbi:TPA: hypothetical protein ACRRXA_001908 [Morganella morganii]